MSRKTYIAAPFFNEEQNIIVDQIAALCRAFGCEVYSPKDECLYVPGKTDPNKIFTENLISIGGCDFLVAVTDGKDPGTLFECGYAYANNVPIVYVWLQNEGMKFNIMLKESGVVVCKSLKALSDVLHKIKDWDHENMAQIFIEWNKEIELE